jgi:hypothetical protein
VPHEATVRAVPQLSVPVKAPHVFPCRAQKAVSVSGVQLQTLVGWQVCGEAQVPHEATVRAVPQLSVPVKAPHVFPCRAQKVVSVSGAQLQTFVGWQVCGEVQVPHEATVRAVPQLSVPVKVPHVFPCRAQKAAFVSGVHAHWPEG